VFTVGESLTRGMRGQQGMEDFPQMSAHSWGIRAYSVSRECAHLGKSGREYEYLVRVGRAYIRHSGLVWLL
jgi:hypothetical protein